MLLVRCLTIATMLASTAIAEELTVFLEDNSGARIEVAKIDLDDAGGYTIDLSDGVFTDHFLSMRPFKCLEGPDKHWCHVPYPYEIAREVEADLTDLEYDFMFVWKGAAEYGINMWNGVYYVLRKEGDALVGVMHEMDMDQLSAPPTQGELRPIGLADLHKADPDSHWLPRMIIE